MKNKWKKIVAGMLAVVMVLTSIVFDFGKATEAEAASDTTTVEADFTKDTATVLDTKFQATQGTTDEERANSVASSVTEYWNTAKGQSESVNKKLVNAALEGTASFSGSKIGSGAINNGILTDWVGMGFSSDVAANYTATIDFKDNAFYEISNVTIQWREHSSDHFIPVKFEVQANTGSAWITIATEDNCGTDALSWSVDLEKTVICSGIRVVSKEMRKTSTYAIIFSEIQTWGVACTNVAREGTESLSDSKIGSGSLINGSTGDWVGMGFVADATKACTATVNFKNGGFYEISNIVIYWRNSSKDQYIPIQFEVQANTGREWIKIAEEDNCDTTVLSWSIALEQSIVCSGVRVVAKKMSGSGSYAIVFSELQVWGEARTNAALGGTQTLSDSKIGSGYINNGSLTDWVGMGFVADATKACTATAYFKNNEFYEISNVAIHWREHSTDHYIPVKFEVQAYNGRTWVKIAEEDNCGTESLLWRAELEQPIICSGVRVVSKEMRGSGSYAIIFSELQAWGEAQTNAALGGVQTLSGSKIGSGSINNGVLTDWVGMGFVADATTNLTASVNFKNNGLYKISKVIIHWREHSTDHYIPVKFEVQAYTGSQWEKIAEEDNCGTDSLIWSADLIEPILCSGIRVVAKEMRGGSSYAIILSELEAWGTKVTNYLTTKASYNSETPISTLLTWKEKTVENFRAEIQMSYYDVTQTKYALYYGQSDMTTLEGAKSVSLIRPYNNHGAISASGLKQLPYIPEYTEEDVYEYVTAYNTSGPFNPSGDTWYMKDTIKNFPTSYNEDNIQTLNVEVLDGVVKMWWTGFEKAAWKAELTDGYTGGYVSLVSLGNNQGGFKSFKLYEIGNEDVKVAVGMDVKSAGAYTVVSVSGDLADNILKSSDIEGSLIFDQSKFEYRKAIIDINHENVNQDAVFNATDGSLPLSLTSCKAGTIVKIYFKNLTDDLDYTELRLDIDSVSRANGKSATAVVTENVAHDYTGDTKGVADKKIDIRDLIHASVNDKAPANVREVLVGIGDPEVDELLEEFVDVYVNVAASDNGNGTESQPYNSMETAYRKVKDGGTIHIVDTYGITAENNSIGVDGKAVTLTGGTLDLSGKTIVQIAGPVTLDGITVNTGSNVIYANGNKFVVNSNVSFNGKIFAIFGGSTGSDVVISYTHLELYAGDYQLIYGGSEYGTIQNDTNLIVGGNVNTGYDDILDHGKSTTHNIFGGSSKGVVKGNTNVTIKDNAMTCIAYGGGNGSASKVEGICKLTIQDNSSVMGYYGGSYFGEVAATEVVMTGGTVEQLFGGSWGADVNGSTTVTWTGGTITRRIFGGCYNDDSSSNIVSGTSTLNIGGNANFSHSTGSDRVICAGSRYSSSSDAETSVLNITTDKYSSYSSYIDTYILNFGSSDTVNTVTTLP